MSHLTGKRVAILATDGFEQSELTEPLRALREHKADVDIVSLDGGRIQGFKHFDKGDQVEVTYTEALALPEINYLLNEAIFGNPHLEEPS